jgi:hypothetical protein
MLLRHRIVMMLIAILGILMIRSTPPRQRYQSPGKNVLSSKRMGKGRPIYSAALHATSASR